MAISASAAAYTSPRLSHPSNPLPTAAAAINFRTKLASTHLSSSFLAPFPTAKVVRGSFIVLAARGNFERNRPLLNNGSIGHVDLGKTTPAAALSMALAAKKSSETDGVPEEFETKKRQYQGRPKKKKESTEVYAHAIAQNIRMSAHKVRRVIDQIRGRSYEETLMILELMPYRACYPIFKLVYSAAANATHNMGLNEANLVISEAQVNEGTPLKRTRTRARGRSDMIRKPTCHIKVVLKENNKYLD